MKRIIILKVGPLLTEYKASVSIQTVLCSASWSETKMVWNGTFWNKSRSRKLKIRLKSSKLIKAAFLWISWEFSIKTQRKCVWVGLNSSYKVERRVNRWCCLLFKNNLDITHTLSHLIRWRWYVAESSLNSLTLTTPQCHRKRKCKLQLHFSIKTNMKRNLRVINSAAGIFQCETERANSHLTSKLAPKLTSLVFIKFYTINCTFITFYSLK